MSWLFSDTDEGPRTTRWSFYTGMVVGALALATLWVGVAITMDAGSDGDRTAGGEPGVPRPTVLGRETAAPRATESSAGVPDLCEQVHTMQTPVLRAAAASLAGWSVHVDAMNQLVAGEITLAQASAFWNRTRREAAGLLDRYNDAAATYAARTIRCPAAAATDAHADQADNAAQAIDCQKAVSSRNAVLRRARAALATWRKHVHHMEMLRAGNLSPARAVRLWQSSWRAGVNELRAYDEARRAAVGDTC